MKQEDYNTCNQDNATFQEATLVDLIQNSEANISSGSNIFNQYILRLILIWIILESDYPHFTAYQTTVGKVCSFLGCLQPGRLQSSPQGWVYGVPIKEQPFPIISC